MTKTLTTTVLGRAVGNGTRFAVSVAALVREYAQHARDVAGSAFDGPFSARQIQTLEGLAEYIACLSLADQRLYSLWLLNAGSSDRWTPAENQITMLPPTPSSEAGFAEKKPDVYYVWTDLVCVNRARFDEFQRALQFL